MTDQPSAPSIEPLVAWMHNDSRALPIDESTQALAAYDLKCEELRLMKVQVRVSDEAFNFHLKRANDLDARAERLEVALRECVVALTNHPEQSLAGNESLTHARTVLSENTKEEK